MIKQPHSKIALVGDMLGEGGAERVQARLSIYFENQGVEVHHIIVRDIVTYTYDVNGNKIRREYDFDADGTVDRIYNYAYDANGNRTKYEYDSDGDGTLDVIRTYTYFNTVLCPDLAKGLVHKLLVDIPESGVWRFSLCGSDFQNVMALSSTFAAELP